MKSTYRAATVPGKDWQRRRHRFNKQWIAWAPGWLRLRAEKLAAKAARTAEFQARTAANAEKRAAFEARQAEGDAGSEQTK